MVRPKGTSKNDSNHKLTDFFSSMSSSQQFRSSQPTPSSSLSSSFAKGKRPVRISDKDGNLASLFSKFSELDREYVEKVYLECNRDYGRANATLHRGRRASLTPKCQSATSAAASVDEPFEKLKTLMPKLSRERFDEAYRACGGDAKKTAKMLLPPEYRDTLRSVMRPGPSGSSSPMTSAARRRGSKPNTENFRSPSILQVQQPVLSQSPARSNRDKPTAPTKSQPVSIPRRPAKKENAPPPDVISISSEHSHFTITSGITPSHISISSTEPVFPGRQTRRAHLTVGDAEPQLARRSPRNRTQPTVERETRLTEEGDSSRPRKKRKLSYESGSDEVVELTSAGDVVFAETWLPPSGQPVLKVEPPSSKVRCDQALVVNSRSLQIRSQHRLRRDASQPKSLPSNVKQRQNPTPILKLSRLSHRLSRTRKSLPCPRTCKRIRRRSMNPFSAGKLALRRVVRSTKRSTTMRPPRWTWTSAWMSETTHSHR